MRNNLLGNRDLIRAINRSSILNIIKNYGPIARVEIARRTGLSQATISGITRELIRKNLVLEKETGDSSGGRPPILLAINPRGGFVVGIKLTETQAIGALTDLEATILTKRTEPITDHTPASVVKNLAELVNALVSESGVFKKQLLGVGVGLAGIIDAGQGILRQSPIYKWHDVPLQKLLQKQVNTPVYIDNDVNTLTLAEKLFGSGQTTDDFVVVTIGRGVGMGIVFNGQFYRGVGGGAGELGHTVVDPLGLLCECGKRGCLETYVGDPALLRAAAEAWKRGEMSAEAHSPEELASLAAAGDAGAIHIFKQAGEVLGRSIANLVNIFNPKIIILSGEGTRAGKFLFDPMCETIQRFSMPGLAKDVEIKIDAWGDDAWARGAACLVLQELFNWLCYFSR
jgi:predicted NBD/HSP70 family sugar kinase